MLGCTKIRRFLQNIFKYSQKLKLSMTRKHANSFQGLLIAYTLTVASFYTNTEMFEARRKRSTAHWFTLVILVLKTPKIVFV